MIACSAFSLSVIAATPTSPASAPRPAASTSTAGREEVGRTVGLLEVVGRTTEAYPARKSRNVRGARGDEFAPAGLLC
ncbi:hypothetical protein GCM10009616_07880 [Microlunatus lacustris]